MSDAPERYSFGSFVVDCTERLLLRDGDPVAVREKVFGTLECFVRNPGRLLPKEELLETIWPDAHVSEANLNQCVSELRRILGDAQLIQTVPKRGFRFVATVENATEISTPKTRLRRIAAPVAIAATFVAIMASPLAMQRGDRPADDPPSVAVVPFRMLGGSPANAYLTASLSATLTARLGTIGRLLVRTGPAGEDAIRAGERLGVGTVVSGSVIPTADRLRILPQVIDVRTKTILWSRSFECTPGDLSIVEDALAAEVANKVRPGLTEEERALLTPPHSRDAIANDEYLRGRDLLDRRSLPESVPHFERALARDPRFALAWAALGEALAVPWGIPGSSDVARAEDAARRAIRLEPQLPEGHAVLGFINLFHKWEFAPAERELRVATRMRPGSPRFHDWLAFALMTRGDLDGAVREVEKAHEIDPLSGDIATDLALMRFEARDYARAESAARVADSIGASTCRKVLIDSLTRQRRTTDALAEIAASDALPQEDRFLLRALVFVANGDAAARQQVLDFMSHRGGESTTADGNAETLALVGANELALQWLERAYRDHAFGLIFIGVAPELDGLRGDARFRELVRRVGVVERAPRS